MTAGRPVFEGGCYTVVVLVPIGVPTIRLEVLPFPATSERCRSPTILRIRTLLIPLSAGSAAEILAVRIVRLRPGDERLAFRALGTAGLQDTFGNLQGCTDERKVIAYRNILDIAILCSHLFDQVVDQHTLVQSILPAAGNEKTGDAALFTERAFTSALIATLGDLLILGNIQLILVEVVEQG